MTIKEEAALQTTIVVPCYNEAERLRLDRFEQFASDQPDINFLFVDDGSNDATSEIIQTLVDAQPDRFQLLKLEVNSGKAEAVRAGFLKALEAPPTWVGFWDADLSTPLDELPRMLEIFSGCEEISMVFGARVKLLGRSIERKLHRHYLGRLFATVVSWILGLAIYDTQCGAKLFRVDDVLPEVMRERFLSKWVFDVEIIARYIRASREGLLPQVSEIIYEMPLMQWHDVEGSKLRARDFLLAIRDLNRIYWKTIGG